MLSLHLRHSLRTRSDTLCRLSQQREDGCAHRFGRSCWIHAQTAQAIFTLLLHSCTPRCHLNAATCRALSATKRRRVEHESAASCCVHTLHVTKAASGTTAASGRTSTSGGYTTPAQRAGVTEEAHDLSHSPHCLFCRLLPRPYCAPLQLTHEKWHEHHAQNAVDRERTTRRQLVLQYIRLFRTFVVHSYL